MHDHDESTALIASLRDGARQLGIRLDDTTARKLIDFARLLQRWNKVYNLTAVDDLPTMIPRHLLDSLAAAPFLTGVRVVDVGTGAGLPGLPLALCAPHREFVLLDAAGKRIRFVRHALAELGIENATAVQSRAEDYRPPAGFDTVIARAFAPLPRLLETVGHLCGAGGTVLALKGPRAQSELTNCPAEWRFRTVSVTVPGLAAERCIVRCERRSTAGKDHA